VTRDDDVEDDDDDDNNYDDDNNNNNVFGKYLPFLAERHCGSFFLLTVRDFISSLSSKHKVNLQNTEHRFDIA
jgi:hypothetical protein